MIDLYVYYLEPVIWLILQLGWLAVAVIAVKKVGGKGAWFLVAGALFGFLIQAIWTLDMVLTNTYLPHIGLVKYSSWSWLALRVGEQWSNALIAVGVLFIVLESSGRKARVSKLELLHKNSIR